MKNTLFAIVVAILAVVSVGYAQTSKKKSSTSTSTPQKPPPPPPHGLLQPGQTFQQGDQQVKVVSTKQRFNFSKLTRSIILPIHDVIILPHDLPGGVVETPGLKSPSAKAQIVYDNVTTTMPGFPAPAFKRLQVFKGKNMDGSVLFMEFSKGLPDDARVKIARILYNADEKPEGKDTMDEFLVNERQIIIWSFKNADSEVKINHQKKIFDVIGNVAAEMQRVGKLPQDNK